MSSARGIALAGLLVFAASPQILAGLDVDFPDVDHAAGVAIHLRSMLNGPPHAGFAPLRITIRNDAPEARRWSFALQSRGTYQSKGAMLSQLSVEVPAQSEKSVEFLAPVTPLMAAYRYPQVTIAGSGPGVNGAYTWAGITSPYRSTSHTPAMAISDALAAPIWGELESNMKASSRDLRASQVDPALLPADPLGWVGWDVVWLADHEWAAASASQRRALTDWIKLGGRLVLVTEGPAPAPAVDLPAAEAASLGAGSVDRIALRAGTKELLNRITGIVDSIPGLVDTVSSGYQGRWPLRDQIPDIHVRTGPITLFVIFFAVLIGPVNLIVLSRRRRHMHLFWTTPALALLASFGLGLVIVLQDGFGGRGARFSLVYLDHETHQSYTWQEQVSRTGVLLNRSFPRAPGSFLADLPLYGSSDELAPGARLSGETWSGEWFTSRRVQAQLLCAIQPTRARVRVSGGSQGPTVISELAAPLARIVYTDAEGKFWQAEAVQPGVRQPLRPATAADFDLWWKTSTAAAGPRIKQALPARDRRSWFVAEATGDSEHVLPTLGSIRWTQRALLYHGPVEQEAGS